MKLEWPLGRQGLSVVVIHLCADICPTIVEAERTSRHRNSASSSIRISPQPAQLEFCWGFTSLLSWRTLSEGKKPRTSTNQYRFISLTCDFPVATAHLICQNGQAVPRPSWRPRSVVLVYAVATATATATAIGACRLVGAIIVDSKPAGPARDNHGGRRRRSLPPHHARVGHVARPAADSSPIGGRRLSPGQNTQLSSEEDRLPQRQQQHHPDRPDRHGTRGYERR